MDIIEKFSGCRAAAEASYDSNFFSKTRVLEYLNRAKAEQDLIDEIEEFLDSADATTLRFMWHFYYFQFCTKEDFSLAPNLVESVPMPQNAKVAHIRAVVYLMAVDNLAEWTKGKEVCAEEIIENYFERYTNMAALNRISHGTPVFHRLSYFLYAYAKPAILRVGRLNFQYAEYRNYCEMYEDENNNRIFAALPNYTYNEQGVQDTEGFVPFYDKSENTLTAHLFDKRGRLGRSSETLQTEKLNLALKTGDKVITIHIPEGGPLLRDEVLRSIREAERVFGKYFPPYKAVVCHTWFLDPALRDEVIKEGSNLADFADLFDVISGTDNNNHSIYEHVFKVKRQPLENLVPTNGFTKRLLDRAIRGEKLYWGYGVLKNRYRNEK